MENNQRIPVLANFWYITDREKDSTLYCDQLGWQENQKVESGGYTEVEDVWKHLVGFTSDKVVGIYASSMFPIIHSIILIKWQKSYISCRYQTMCQHLCSQELT